MWSGNPVLTTVLFGLPFGFLSLILYSICCADILDAEEDDEEGKHIGVCNHVIKAMLFVAEVHEKKE